jgi:type IV secretory pathway TrbD component
MLSNIVYAITTPKTMMGTDKNLALLILFTDVVFTWVTYDWKMAIGAIAVSYLLIKFAQRKSIKDPWWFQLYKPYNRYADIYVPWVQEKTRERYNRPYGFGRDTKL